MMDSEDEEYGEIRLPKQILNRTKQRIQHTEFDSSEEYITYVLEEVLYRVEKMSDDRDESVNENEVKSRLKSLGYLNE